MPDSKKGSNRYSALPEIPKEFESPQQFSQLVNIVYSYFIGLLILYMLLLG
jgi:hypothetical protein